MVCVFYWFKKKAKYLPNNCYVFVMVYFALTRYKQSEFTDNMLVMVLSVNIL